MSNINWDEAPEGDTVRYSKGCKSYLRQYNGKIQFFDDVRWRYADEQSVAMATWKLSTVRPVIKNKDKPELTYQKSDTNDAVNAPSHYSLFENVEAIQLLASSMTEVEFRGYCFGNMLKYRARVGGKDDVNQEIGKANKYKELFAKYKNLCRTASLFGD